MTEKDTATPGTGVLVLSLSLAVIVTDCPGLGREADGVTVTPGTFYRERFRYALRFGLRGELVDNFNYGIRLETSNNPRSPWDTFGNNTTP